MVKIFPFIFILLWSSAFITTKPIIDNSDPVAALAFRFALVTFGFFLFSLYSKEKILVNKRNVFESFFSGVLFHGFYLGGVFYSISIGMPTGIAALIVTLQPILTNALSGPILNEKVSTKQWLGVLLGFVGAALVLGFDIGSKIPTAGLVATIIALLAITFSTLWQKKLSNSKQKRIFELERFILSQNLLNIYAKKEDAEQLLKTKKNTTFLMRCYIPRSNLIKILEKNLSNSKNNTFIISSNSKPFDNSNDMFHVKQEKFFINTNEYRFIDVITVK